MKKFLYLILVLLTLNACGARKKTDLAVSKYDPVYIEAFHEAVRMKVRGQVNEAITGFEKCLTIRQDDDAVYYALSQLYLQKNDRPKSAENIQQAGKIDPDNIWYTQEIAYMLYESGNFTEAIKQFEKLVKHEPRNVEWIYGYAESLVKAGKISDAIKAYDKMEEQIGKHPELAIQKFNLYLQLKQDEKALNEINTARKEFPEDGQLIAALVDYYFQKGQQEKAIGMLEELVIADPQNGRAHLALADVYRKKGEQAKAYVELKKAFACEDVTIDNKMQILINIHETSAKIDPEVLELVDMVVQMHPTEAKAHSIRGDYMLRLEKDDEALKSYKEALKYDKKLFPIWNQVMIMEYQQNNFEDLYVSSKECLEYFSTMPTVYLLNGVAAVQLKKYEEALSTLEAGIELVVNDKSTVAEFYGQMGEAHFGLQQNELAKENYEKALKTDPQSLLLKSNYAYRLAFIKSELTKALNLINEVLKESEQTAVFNDTKGFVLFQSEKYTDAKAFYEKADKLNPNDKLTVEHLGDVYFKLGDKVKGVEFWKKAKELGSKNKSLDKKIEKKEYYDPSF
jgi:tetratricopeptide (TPR) repeat protein